MTPSIFHKQQLPPSSTITDSLPHIIHQRCSHQPHESPPSSPPAPSSPPYSKTPLTATSPWHLPPSQHPHQPLPPPPTGPTNAPNTPTSRPDYRALKQFTPLVPTTATSKSTGGTQRSTRSHEKTPSFLCFSSKPDDTNEASPIPLPIPTPTALPLPLPRIGNGVWGDGTWGAGIWAPTAAHNEPWVLAVWDFRQSTAWLRKAGWEEEMTGSGRLLERSEPLGRAEGGECKWGVVGRGVRRAG